MENNHSSSFPLFHCPLGNYRGTGDRYEEEDGGDKKWERNKQLLTYTNDIKNLTKEKPKNIPKTNRNNKARSNHNTEQQTIKDKQDVESVDGLIDRLVDSRGIEEPQQKEEDVQR